MLIKNMAKEDLEILSYADLTELILKEENKPLNTPTIFKRICEILNHSEEEYMDKIGDYYTSLATDKRFVFLDTNEWDLREKNPIDIVMDEDDDEEDISLEDEEYEEEKDEYERDIDSTLDDEELDDVEEDMEDLAILSDEELEEN